MFCCSFLSVGCTSESQMSVLGQPGLGAASLCPLWALPAPAFVWCEELQWFVGLKMSPGFGILELHWFESSLYLQLLSVGCGNTACRNQGFQNGTGIHV